MNVNNVDIQEYVNDDWKEQLTDKNIVGLVKHGDRSHLQDDNQGAGNDDRMSHGGEWKAVRTSLPYNEQEKEMTITTDILLCRLWHNVAAEEVKNAHNKYSLHIFSKSELPYKICITLNSILVFEI